MSLNIYIVDSEGNEIPFWQTPTYVTERIIQNVKGNSNKEKDLHAVDLLEEWVMNEIAPKPLTGKDARNPFLLERHSKEIQELYKNKFEYIRKVINKNINGQRLVGYI